MENADLIDLLFDKQEDDDIFNFKDNLLEELDNKIERDSNKLNTFIDRRVHPKTRRNLKELIRKSETSIDEYNRRENQLYYKNGVTDGVKLILKLLSFK